MKQFQLPGYAVVVGASGGIGSEVALSFAEAGVRGILCADLDQDGAANTAKLSKALASNAGCEVVSAKVNITEACSIKTMLDLAITRFGRIDYCINAVGVDTLNYYSFEDTPLEDYDRLLSINAKGALMLMQDVVRIMKTQSPLEIDMGRHGRRDAGCGSIVNVSSAMSVAAVPLKTSYVTSKHALLGMTRSCALECKSDGIRVNSVSPTWVKTPMYEEDCRRQPMTPLVVKKLSGIKRPMEPEEVATACLYLCCPSSVSITGANLIMDSGISAGVVI